MENLNYYCHNTEYPLSFSDIPKAHIIDINETLKISQKNILKNKDSFGRKVAKKLNNCESLIEGILNFITPIRPPLNNTKIDSSPIINTLDILKEESQKICLILDKHFEKESEHHVKGMIFRKKFETKQVTRFIEDIQKKLRCYNNFYNEVTQRVSTLVKIYATIRCEINNEGSQLSHPSNIQLIYRTLDRLHKSILKKDDDQKFKKILSTLEYLKGQAEHLPKNSSTEEFKNKIERLILSISENPERYNNVFRLSY